MRLVADDLTYPVFRFLWAPEVLLAISGWVLAAGLITWWYPRYAYLAFDWASRRLPSNHLPTRNDSRTAADE